MQKLLLVAGAALLQGCAATSLLGYSLAPDFPDDEAKGVALQLPRAQGAGDGAIQAALSTTLLLANTPQTGTALRCSATLEIHSNGRL